MIMAGFGGSNRMKESPIELNWACETRKYKQQVVRGRNAHGNMLNRQAGI
ncbi:hypothetical protein VIMY103929_11005 [Vibrio mytili]